MEVWLLLSDLILEKDGAGVASICSNVINARLQGRPAEHVGVTRCVQGDARRKHLEVIRYELVYTRCTSGGLPSVNQTFYLNLMLP